MTKNKDVAMGPSGYNRLDADFYPTPAWCTELLLKKYKFTGSVWEPACGDGAISKVLYDRGFKVFSTDLHDRGFGLTGETDFLKQDKIFASSINIITNPPYNLAEEFIRHSLKLVEPVQGAVAMLLRNEYDSASSRTDLFTNPAFSIKIVLTKRPRWIADTNGSPRHNYAWFIWDFGPDNKGGKLDWGQ